MGVTLTEGGVTLRGDMLLTTTTLLFQRAEPSLSWLGATQKIRIGGGINNGFPVSGTE